MSGPVFVIAFVAVPLVFTAMDLVDRHLTRHSRYDGERLRAGTVVFLAAVLLVYAVLQCSGFAVLPGIGALADQVREVCGRWCGRCLDDRPMDGVWCAVLVVLLFYVGGLWDYLMHRFVSHSRWLWFTHEYHHLPNQVFVLMPGVAARPFAVVSTFPVTAATVVSAYGVVALFDLPVWDLAPLQILLVLHVFVLTSSHSSCLRRWWWVHRALACLAVTTPQEHALHHTVRLKGNYGNFTTLWDRVFGTYLDPARPEHQGHAFGLAYDQDFLGAITLGALKLPDRVRRRFQVGRYCNLFDRDSASSPPTDGR
jgi:sterol desaturase/sphingolipid hydroxylase (fatty acid hydroxylase superfamily)